MQYLQSVKTITENGDLTELPFNTQVVKLILVLSPQLLDFSSIIEYYAANESVPLSTEETPFPTGDKMLQVQAYVDRKCTQCDFGSQDFGLGNFIKSKLILMDLSVNQTSQILSSLLQRESNLDDLNHWYRTRIQPLHNSHVQLTMGQLYQLDDYETCKLLLLNIQNDTKLVDKNIGFISDNWIVFNQWFENEYAPNNMLIPNKSQIIKSYENLLVSFFENQNFLNGFIKSGQPFEQFVSTLFGCFYLCPIVHERILVVIKHIFFIIKENISVPAGDSSTIGTSLAQLSETDSLQQASKILGIHSIPYLSNLITSVEKLYQLEMSIKDILKLVDDYDLQVSVITKLINLNVNEDLYQLYNSINWVLSNTNFFNKVPKAEIDLIFFNKLIKSKKFSILEKLMEKKLLVLQNMSELILEDFYDNFNQSSNFNLNSHFLQDCLKDLRLLKNINPIEHEKLSKLISSFKILNNFKILNSVIRPSEILSFTALEVIDRIFELNNDVDIFEIYQLSQDLIVGLDDQLLKKELTDSDPVYDYKHLSKTENRILVRLLIVELKYSISRESNYNMLISLLSNSKISDILVENWFIIYQYTSYHPGMEDEDQQNNNIKQVEILLKVLKIVSLFILIIPVEFNSRLTLNFVQYQNELIAKINQLQSSNLSEESKPRTMDLESRIARLFTSSTKDILKDLLV